MKTLLILFAAALFVGCSKSHDHSPAAQTYWCPMHPEVTSTDPNAECDKCGGMKLLPKEPDAKPTAAAPASKGAKYFCPMHPQITSDKRGTCPICNMDLVPANQDEHAGHSMVAGLATVKVSAEVRQQIGLKLGKVETRNLAREIRTSARILPDETRLWRVTTKVEGWVDKLFVAVTGQEVKAGDPLLSVYSPDLFAAQKEYVVALDAKTPELLTAAKRRLELLDVTEAQIAELEKSREPKKNLTVFAPAGGFVTEKMVLAGQKLMPGESLMVVADLSTVWADADLYQSDLGLVKLGQPVELALAGKTYAGKVIFVTPTIDAMTRTARARIEIRNPEIGLKPEMYASATIQAELGSSLSIPASAVMRTGEKTYAFRDEGAGKLMPVEIKIGARSGEHFQLLEGLQDGDQVVTSANFLIDSESQLKAALSGMSGHQH